MTHTKTRNHGWVLAIKSRNKLDYFLTDYPFLLENMFKFNILFMSIGSLTAGPALAAHLEAAEMRDKAETPPDLRARAVLTLSKAETAALTQDVIGDAGDGPLFIAGREYRVADASGDSIVLEAAPAPTPRPLSPEQQQALDGYNENGGFTLAGVIEASFLHDADTETYTVRIEPQENVKLEEPTEVSGVTVPEHRLALAMNGQMTNPVFGNLLEDLGLNVPGVGGYGPDTVIMGALDQAPVRTDHLVALLGPEKAEELKVTLRACLDEELAVADELEEEEERLEWIAEGEAFCAEDQERDVDIAFREQRVAALRAQNAAKRAVIESLRAQRDASLAQRDESLARRDASVERTAELLATGQTVDAILADIDDIHARLTNLVVTRAICELQGKPDAECTALDDEIERLSEEADTLMNGARQTIQQVTSLEQDGVEVAEAGKGS